MGALPFIECTDRSTSQLSYSKLHNKYTMSSGVAVQNACVTEFNDIKLKHKYRYIIFSLTPDLREIAVLKTAPTSATYNDFLEDMTEAEQAKECRYAVFDADYTLKDGQQRSKLVFFLWSPECAKIKQKMVYTSSKDNLKKKLVGVAKEVQACDQDDLSWESVVEVLKRTEVA